MFVDHFHGSSGTVRTWPALPRPPSADAVVSRTPRSVDLPLDPHAPGPGPLPQRLADQLRDLVATGTLRPGDPLPATRTLANRLGISRGSVVVAYEQLTAEGYLRAVHGSGTVVHPQLARLPRPVPTTPTPAPVRSGPEPAPMIDLRPGVISTEFLATAAWRTAWRRAAADPGGVADSGRRASSGAESLPAAGASALRQGIAERLRRVRAVAADPENILVTAGARDGLQVLLAAMAAAAGRPLTIAFEAPGSPSLRRLPALLGHRTLDAPVDVDGLDPEQLPGGIDVLVVTPSHQFPTGGSLPLARRLALLEHARRDGFLVLEDDYTAEWRWEGAPLPALAGLDDPADPHVALLGSMSSLVGPHAGFGFLLVPMPWRTRLLQAREVLGGMVGGVAQAAWTDLISGGALDRHVQRMRARHRQNLVLLRSRIGQLPTVAVPAVPGGLSAVVLTDPGPESAADENALVAEAAAAGVLVSGLAEYWGGSPPRRGILVGFGGRAEDLRTGLDLLVAVLTGTDGPG